MPTSWTVPAAPIFIVSPALIPFTVVNARIVAPTLIARTVEATATCDERVGPVARPYVGSGAGAVVGSSVVAVLLVLVVVEVAVVNGEEACNCGSAGVKTGVDAGADVDAATADKVPGVVSEAALIWGPGVETGVGAAASTGVDGVDGVDGAASVPGMKIRRRA